MLTPRSRHGAVVLMSGKVLVTGNADFFGCGPPTEIYDPDTGSWSEVGETLDRRLNPSLTLMADGTVLLPDGGCGPTSISGTINAELFDPATGTWSRLPLMHDFHTSHTATLLNNKLVLVAGNNYELDSRDIAELFHPNGVQSQKP